MGAGPLSCQKPLKNLPVPCMVDPRCEVPRCFAGSDLVLGIFAHSVKLKEDADSGMRQPCDPVIEVVCGADCATFDDSQGSPPNSARTPQPGIWRSGIGGWEWEPLCRLQLPFNVSKTRLTVRLLMRVAPPGFDVLSRPPPRELTVIASTNMVLGEDVLPRARIGASWQPGVGVQAEVEPMPVLLMADMRIAGIAILSFELIGGGNYAPTIDLGAVPTAQRERRPRASATSHRDGHASSVSNVSSKDLESFPLWRQGSCRSQPEGLQGAADPEGAPWDYGATSDSTSHRDGLSHCPSHAAVLACRE